MFTFIFCIILLIGSYFTYAKYLEHSFEVDKKKATPSSTLYDGVDYIPLPAWKTFLIQLLNIAGLGPIFGALLGAMYGPVAFLWITFGSIFIGALQDYASGMISLRHNGMSFPEIVGNYLGISVKQVMRIVTLLLMVLVGAVFMVGPAGILENMTSVSKDIWVWIILFYYILATLLPIDKIIGHFYPIFGAALLVMAFGILYALFFQNYTIPEITAGTLRNMKSDPSAFPIFPTLFITIACGAISGFHATQSPMMARCITNEKQGRPVFFGAMIAESIIALIWAAIGMAFWGGVGELNTTLAEHGNNAAWAVDVITKTTLGKIGAILALLGVVIAPITSGDTAFRSARLIAADFMKLEQRSWIKRLYICIPLFIIGYGITLMQFDIIWKYFAWINQTLAAICLWTITVYLMEKQKNFWIALIPSIFMTYIVSLYILIAQEGLTLPYSYGVIISIGITSLVTLGITRKLSTFKKVKL
ncbi:MAG: carbon starvation CstA family protein [Bacteroidales bacterium]|nr:carbon starvation CstA family protein [Bacteroidales bacterium]